MKNAAKKWTAMLALAVLAVGLAGDSGVQAEPGKGKALGHTHEGSGEVVIPEIVGAWNVIDDNFGDLFFLTFNFGGTMSLTVPADGVSPSHGNWVDLGGGQYSATDRAFLFDPATGGVAFIEQIRYDITVSGGMMTGDIIIEILFTDGTLINSATTSFTATPIDIIPLP